MSQYRKVSLIILVMFTISLLAYFIKEVSATGNPTYGNTCGNYQNAGYVAKYKDSIYYIVSDKTTRKQSIMRLAPDGKSEVVLTDNYDINGIGNMNIANDSIYFNNGHNALYKLDIKTKKLSRVGVEGDRFAGAIIYGDWVYYSKPNKTARGGVIYGEIWRMKLDGTKMELLDKDIGVIRWVYDGWIYYQLHEDKTNSKGGYYKMKLDGTQKTKMNFQYWIYPNFENNWIYYQDDINNCIYKVKLDGSGKTKLDQGRFFDINVSNGWIYYLDNIDIGNLYKIKINGKEKSLLGKDVARGIYIVDGWIYYNGSDSHKYRMKIDGTNKSMIY